MIAIKGIVSGRVQGVGFRLYVQAIAQQMALTGYAKNLPDGCVEVLLCGEAERVTSACKKVALGPPASQVDNVGWEEIDPVPEVEGFGYY